MGPGVFFVISKISCVYLDLFIRQSQERSLNSLNLLHTTKIIYLAYKEPAQCESKKTSLSLTSMLGVAELPVWSEDGHHLQNQASIRKLNFCSLHLICRPVIILLSYMSTYFDSLRNAA